MNGSSTIQSHDITGRGKTYIVSIKYLTLEYIAMAYLPRALQIKSSRLNGIKHTLITSIGWKK